MKKRLWIAAMSLVMAAAVWAPSSAAAESAAFCRAVGSTCSSGDQCCSDICECGLISCSCE